MTTELTHEDFAYIAQAFDQAEVIKEDRSMICTYQAYVLFCREAGEEPLSWSEIGCENTHSLVYVDKNGVRACA